MDTPIKDESGRIVVDDDGELVALTPQMIRRLLSDQKLREQLRHLAMPMNHPGDRHAGGLAVSDSLGVHEAREST